MVSNSRCLVSAPKSVDSSGVEVLADSDGPRYITLERTPKKTLLPAVLLLRVHVLPWIRVYCAIA
jgi:hypothetical protein